MVVTTDYTCFALIFNMLVSGDRSVGSLAFYTVFLLFVDLNLKEIYLLFD